MTAIAAAFYIRSSVALMPSCGNGHRYSAHHTNLTKKILNRNKSSFLLCSRVVVNALRRHLRKIFLMLFTAVATAQARDVILQAINSLDDVNSTRTCSAESLMHIVTKAKEVLARLELKIADHKRTLGQYSDLKCDFVT